MTGEEAEAKLRELAPDGMYVKRADGPVYSVWWIDSHDQSHNGEGDSWEAAFAATNVFAVPTKADIEAAIGDLV